MARKQRQGKGSKKLGLSGRNKKSGKYVRQRSRTEANKARKRQRNS
jgi:hypothetical protein